MKINSVEKSDFKILFGSVLIILYFISVESFAATQASLNLPTLPQTYIDTTFPTQTGVIRNVNATDCNDPNTGLQAQINAANYGDTIVIPAGETCTADGVLSNGAPAGWTYFIPAKPWTSGWIVIESSGLANLPAGVRVNPSQANNMAKISTASVAEAIQVQDGASHWRFSGLEITGIPQGTLASLVTTYALVDLGSDGSTPWETSISQLPSNITFDRDYVHGTPTMDVLRGIWMNGNYVAVVDSYFTDFHSIYSDSQAIGAQNGEGPFKIVNNFLAGGAENIIFGGGWHNIPNLVASDIEVRHNYLYKPWSWETLRGTTVPTGACEWDSHYSILGPQYELTDANGNPLSWYQCQSGSWVQVASQPFPDWQVKNLFELKNAQRVLVDGNVMANNWIHGQNGYSILLNGVDGTPNTLFATIQNVTFTHNIVENIPNGIAICSFCSSNDQISNVYFANNIFDNLNMNPNIPNSGTPVWLGNELDNATFDHNTFLTQATLVSVGNGAWNNTNSQSANFIFTNNIASEGQYGFSGADDGLVFQGGEGTVALNGLFSSYNFTANAIAANTDQYGNMPGVPAALATMYPSGNYFPPVSESSMDFVNYNNGVGGDYHLTASSPYKGQGVNASTLQPDGSDIGADVDAVNSATAGALTGTSTSVFFSLVYGDVNGDGQVTIADAALVAQYMVGLVALTPTQIQSAMVSSNAEKSPSIYDAFLIAQYAIGLITKFPGQA